MKNQARFKLDLNETEIGGKKTKHEKDIMKNINTFLIYEKKLLIFLEIITFCYFKLSTKQNIEKALRY